MDCCGASSLSSTCIFWKTRRYLVTFLLFLGTMVVYALRINLSVAIVPMMSTYNVTLQNGTVIQKQDFPSDSESEGLMLSSFFYGYILTQLLGGWLAARFGGAKVVGVGVLGTALMTVIFPPLAKTSLIVFLLMRAIEGIFQGVIYPSIHEIWAKWAPVAELSTLGSIVYSGSYIGTVITMPAAGFVADNFGWEAVFYITGAVSLIWCAFWLLIVKDDPRSDPHVTLDELAYIEGPMGNRSKNNGKIRHPYGKILTSMPVWAIVVAHTTETWGYFTLITQLPTYMEQTFHLELEKAGFLSSLPSLATAITLLFSGRLSDFIQNSQIISLTKIRKIFCCSAFVCQATSMFLAGHAKSAFSNIVYLVLSVAFGAFAWTAFGLNHLDIAPQHASLTMGLSNAFAALSGILSPLLTGYIVTEGTKQEWRIVFYITCGVYLFGAVFYAIFASGERQSWAIVVESETPTVAYNKGKSNDKAKGCCNASHG